MTSWIALLSLAFMVSPAAAATGEISLPSRTLGTASVYGSKDAGRVVLFLSGDGGWNAGVVNMARALAADGSLVIGLDIRKVFAAMNAGKAACSYPAGMLEGISKSVQRHLKVSAYLPPVVLGYSSGATLAYAALAQAPANAFAGAVSLGFCPDLEVERRLCAGRTLASSKIPDKKAFLLAPTQKLQKPWVVLQGDADKVCSPADAKRFVDGVPGATLVSLPKVGHGFSVARNWQPQLQAIFPKTFPLAKREPPTPKPPLGHERSVESIDDLPVVTISAPAKERWGVVFLSGDGGWASLDDGVTGALAEKGIPSLGLNMLKYLWEKKDLETGARDLGRLVARARELWHLDRVVVAGFSAGADLAPIFVRALLTRQANAVAGLALLGPSERASLEFHLSDWLVDEGKDDELPVEPAIRSASASGVRTLCISGRDDDEAVCPRFQEVNLKSVLLEGSHHLNGDYPKVAKLIYEAFTQGAR